MSLLRERAQGSTPKEHAQGRSPGEQGSATRGAHLGEPAQGSTPRARPGERTQGSTPRGVRPVEHTWPHDRGSRAGLVPGRGKVPNLVPDLGNPVQSGLRTGETKQNRNQQKGTRNHPKGSHEDPFLNCKVINKRDIIYANPFTLDQSALKSFGCLSGEIHISSLY